MLAGYHIPAVAVIVAVLLPLAAVTGQPTQWRSSKCASGAYAANGTYQANLALLAAALPANASAGSGFATATVGALPDLISALALCRGDVVTDDTSASSCRACVAAGFRGAQRDCPGRKDATVYQDACVLRFSDQRFLDFVGANSPDGMFSSDSSGDIITAPAALFNAAAVALMNATASHAVTADKYFATGEEDFHASSRYPKIYGLAQCAPDMTAPQCRSCLTGFVANIPWFLNGNPRGRALGIWCNLRYSVDPFYTGGAMVKLSAPAPAIVPSIAIAETGTGRKRRIAGISAGVGCFLLLILILAACAFIRFKRRKANKNDHSALNEMARVKCTVYDFLTLQEATENFAEKHKLGEGGFGAVYKGILPDGHEIAVKKLIDSTGHGLDQIRNEVLVLAQLQHKNLVRLEGFCLHQNEILLVYEFIKNGSLDNFLFDASRRNTLNWNEEYNIVLGIAKGIMYLHEDSSIRIIHRDLKANNILLDEAMDPKIADFGLARLQVGGHTQTKTTRVVGTFGYMAPEYAIHGNVSPKIDIFSFGVLVLEIVTKRRNCGSCEADTVNLLTDVWACWTKGTVSQMIDQSLEGHSRVQALRCVHIGLLCVQSDPHDRPDIPSVIFMLNRADMELQPPAQPAFFFGRDSNSDSQQLEQGTYVYNRSDVMIEDISVNGLTITYPYPR
ncbi:cysteine-rich receptor-like protein kinase 10 isoform X2 [Brachypodium distachyon]|uniref:Protein kinase domain-containing protein n=1 Tax=Brachypodium distachyon TaxID=15368 RepID=A0A0Q3NEY3_BRADI|nr:cysteine-rich receptor-like protein kinase 10 isoform X2 [Brachypodium distachyon]KQK15894.1 hypothetical protein BRADI_1g25630v3 [Brachypodium distachyon]|eukprot:XP_014751869.1 cysteine-rich receptor-like protein kinase 10 isoform X2 [Brachypodium distachyon]